MTAGLLELVSKGKKDVYFVGQPGIFYYNNVYRRVPETAWTQHVLQSKSPAKWGSQIEFELDAVPDLTKNYFLQVHLPSWLPTSVPSAAAPTDASGNQYGYVNCPALYIFEHIEVLADTHIVQRLTPQWLDLAGRRGLLGMADGTTQAATEFGRMVGRRDDLLPPDPRPSYTYVSAGEDELLRTLIVPLPILGCVRPTDPPFPMRAVTGSRITIRARLKKIDTLIESYPVRGLLPFNKELFIDDEPIGIIQEREVFPRGPDICIMYTAGYVNPVVRDMVALRPHAVLIEHVQDQEFALERAVLLAAAAGSPDVKPMRIDFRGPVKVLTVAFQRSAARLARTVADFTDGNGASMIGAATNLRIITNGRDRFPSWMPFFYADPVHYGAPGVGAAQVDCVFDFGLDSGSRSPTGTVNFSAADKILLSIQLGTDMPGDSDRIFVNVFGVGYKVLVIKNGFIEVGTVPGKDIVC